MFFCFRVLMWFSPFSFLSENAPVIVSKKPYCKLLYYPRDD
jgi:hypothetical protein